MIRKARPLTTIFLSLFLLLACNIFGFTIGATSTPNAVPAAVTPEASVEMTSTSSSIGSATATDIPDETTPFSGEKPGEPPAAISFMDDTSEKRSPDAGFANGGDDFADNQYERPFTADMKYRPELDIQRASFSQDANWYYVTIQLGGPNPANDRFTANYGVELDINKDGRGDYVIWTLPAYSKQWKRINTKIFSSTTKMVGGEHPILSDAPWVGATYDKLLFFGLTDSSHDYAWVRIAPNATDSIQIAFSPFAIGRPTQFLWGVWADDGIKDPSKFDYNDQFTKVQAGAAFINDPEFPPKAINAVDNTCRMWVGFTPSEAILGSCQVKQAPGPQPTPTQIIYRGPN
jgi:hypothetical protein